VVAPAQAAAHQAAEGEVVGPALKALPLQESLQLEVSPGFKHPLIVGRVCGPIGYQANGVLKQIDPPEAAP